MCQLPTIRTVSAETGAAVGDVGLTTARPPWSSVPMGVLAGRPFEPAKRSAVHGRHRELGGNVLWAGDWRRPYDYGDPEGETMAVHEGAGLIDVSTLGKLMVRGPEAATFLNHLYPNRFDTLKAGSHPLRGAGRRRREDHRRRHPLPPRRRVVLRHHHLERRRRGRELVRVVARRVADGRPPHRREPGPGGVQPRRAAVARDPVGAHRPGLLERGVLLPRRQASPRRRGSLPAAADRLRGRARVRAPLPRGARRAPLGRDHGRRRAARQSGRSASSPSGCSASRSFTSSSARTPMPSRTRSRLRCRGS